MNMVVSYMLTGRAAELTFRHDQPRNDGCSRRVFQLRNLAHESHSYRDSSILCPLPDLVSRIAELDIWLDTDRVGLAPLLVES
jgi:hypothetical protein